VPAVIPREIALRSRLKDAIEKALSLNEHLEQVIAIKSKQPSGIFHGKIDHSQPPWASSIAHCIMDLHAQSREMEEWLRVALKLPQRHRGGSSANTGKALEAVARLCEGADDHAVTENTKWLDGWIRRAQIALGQKEPPRRIPRLPGQKEPVCPWCSNHTLRMLPMKGVIKCVTPKCVDSEGRKPEARMEYSAHVGDFVIIWQDGLVGGA
jgi:hypothetical protein